MIMTGTKKEGEGMTDARNKRTRDEEGQRRGVGSRKGRKKGKEKERSTI
jgi:hypothetical protein